MKGETSGNALDVVAISADCDRDTLLVLAHPRGPTCHFGKKTTPKRAIVFKHC